MRNKLILTLLSVVLISGMSGCTNRKPLSPSLGSSSTWVINEEQEAPTYLQVRERVTSSAYDFSAEEDFVTTASIRKVKKPKKAKPRKVKASKQKTIKKSKATINPADLPKPIETLADSIGEAAPELKGTAISSEVSESDRAFAEDAQERAVSAATPGSRVTWKNPDSGTSGEIRPGIAFKKNGTSCRPYTHTVTIDGAIKSLSGTLCKGADGVWREKK